MVLTGYLQISATSIVDQASQCTEVAGFGGRNA
jgi:hypothetical protein